ncbi:MAG: thioredoxin family protein [Odoribacter sp.]
MKILVIVCAVLLSGIAGKLSAQGIDFRSGSFEAAQQAARQEKKLIFIDFHTVWCGPCKVLAAKVFPLPEVGSYFNSCFVSCKLDAEKEGRELAAGYGVNSYPTMVFLNTEGDMIHKVTGAVGTEKLLEAAAKALKEANDSDNLGNLRKRYAAEKGNEQFLRKYIAKMVESKEAPYEAIEEFLKIQKSMKEGSSRMMEFLMENANFLLLGGEAERIFNTNKATYMAIATAKEERKLVPMRPQMLCLTREMALQKKDVALYELFLNGWQQLEVKSRHQDYTGLYLDLLLLKGERKAYRHIAEAYLDSIVASRPVAEICESDRKFYDEYCRTHPGGNTMLDAMRESNRNVDARIQTRAIIKVGKELLKDAKRKDFAYYPKWIGYGKQLLPDDYQMPDFEAAVLYREGKKTEAIAAKRKAMGMVKPEGRDFIRMEKELKRMEEGQ